MNAESLLYHCWNTFLLSASLIFLHPVITKFQVFLSDIHHASYSIFSNCHMIFTKYNGLVSNSSNGHSKMYHGLSSRLYNHKRPQVYKAQVHTKCWRQIDLIFSTPQSQLFSLTDEFWLCADATNFVAVFSLTAEHSCRTAAFQVVTCLQSQKWHTRNNCSHSFWSFSFQVSNHNQVHTSESLDFGTTIRFSDRHELDW